MISERDGQPRSAIHWPTLVCGHFIPHYCSLGSDTLSHRAGGATAVVELQHVDTRVAQGKNCHNLSACRFYARQHNIICYSAYMPWQFRLSVCHTGGSVKNGWSYDHAMFTIQ